MPDPLDALRAALGDRYRFEREISRTAMSSVFLAHDLKHDRAVAIKAVNCEFGGPVSRDRFLNEIRLVARFQHPNILPLFDSGEAEDTLYYVMPFVEGEALSDRLQREKHLPVAEAVRLTKEICDGLAYAHARGIVHRDVKPANILLSGGHPLIADFGIAHALDSIGVSMTGTGIVIGTVAYMSPEQAGGQSTIDARSDIYAVGCVLYEMLAGEPPFNDVTPQSMLVKRLVSEPRSVSDLRADVPAEVARTLRRALAVEPAARFASASDFARELVRSLERSAAPPPRAGARRAVAAGGALAIAAAIIAMVVIRGPAVAAAGIAVLPLLHGNPSIMLELDGDNCARLLYDAFSRWSGIDLLNDMVVRDARQRRGGDIASLDDAVAVGRDLGARYVVWGEVAPAAAGVTVRATLFEITGRPRQRKQHSIRVTADSGAAAAFAVLADSLLVGILREVPPAGISGTRNFAALRDYAAAHSALDAWNLATAESLFRAATTADTAYAAAQLELAQVVSWRNGTPAEWRSAALRAKMLAPQLGERQRQLAEALLAIAEGEPQRACDLYRALVSRDSIDFEAWFGLGECQSRDHLVIRDPTSRSRWRFRSSQHAAINAYRRALELAPLFQRALTATAYDRVARLLYTEAGQIRSGPVAPPDTGGYAAYPELTADSLGFVPYPIQAVYASQPGTYPATHMQAVDRNRAVLRDLSRRWVTGAPRDARAHEIFALALESLGELVPAPSSTASAMGALPEIIAARRLATDRTSQVRTAALQVRLLVKLERYSNAARLADSLLALGATAPPQAARYLAGVAALVGRPFTAARWARVAAEELAGRRPPTEPALPPGPTRDAGALIIFAANANEPDSVRRLVSRIGVQLAAVASPAERTAVRANLLDWAVTLAFADLGITLMHRAEAGGNLHMEIEWAMARGDSSAARERLRALRALGDLERPGDAGFDAIALEAELRLALGDTASAVSVLDQTLAAAASSGRQLVEGLAESAGYGRAVARRVALAAGDAPVARHWAQVYVDLYANAEGNTRRVLQSMRSIAAPR